MDQDNEPTLWERYGNEGGIVDASLYERYSKEYAFIGFSNVTENNELEDLPQS